MLELSTHPLDIKLNQNGHNQGRSTLPQGDLQSSFVHDFSTSNNASLRNVVRRNGQLTPFSAEKIKTAMTKAFLAVEGESALDSTRIHLSVEALTKTVVKALFRNSSIRIPLHIEDIQDQVELALMRSGEHKVARAYVLYREEHVRQRLDKDEPQTAPKPIQIILLNQTAIEFDFQSIYRLVLSTVEDLADVDPNKIAATIAKSIYSDIKIEDFYELMIMSCRKFIELEPNYSFASARFLLLKLLNLLPVEWQLNRAEIIETQSFNYSNYFSRYIHVAVEKQLIDPELAQFDLSQLADALIAEQDKQFNYLGLQTLYDRYFLRVDDKPIELPQAFFMRIAMDLAINEIDREASAIEFYRLLSSFDFMCSTPTLFNSGTLRPQLSSCYLSTVPDSLSGIFSSLKDNALLSKYAGGLGNDWTPVRGMGAKILGTQGKSQGVIPFLKVNNDTAVAVNQGGKRKGAICAYLETWHIDIEDFLDLRKNTGDERRRTHDMHSANWIPDLFMQRVIEDKNWTLFSPDSVPDLHQLSGQAFKQKYENYEALAEQGQIKLYRTISAKKLWRKMLTMLFETGHPWLTFKDPCNIRYTNQHCGSVNSSNLCTEITLHTNQHEIAVCNLGSINLANHFSQGQLDQEKLSATIKTAMRMLDNVIDYNFYGVPAARQSNLKHRPVGLGIMGFQDVLYQKNISYASDEAIAFADQCMEIVSYLAIDASCELAKVRGAYSTFSGSLWSQGVLPIDSIELLNKQRDNQLEQDQSTSLDWSDLREKIRTHGMRNSNCLAIAPTATIANICGVSQSIEPTFQNLYVKSNLSGEFSVVNAHLVKQLKSIGIWDDVMVNDLKYFDGSVQKIDRIPESIKSVYLTAFELDSSFLIEAASRRQKWIDQAQSLNLYLAEASGKKLDQLYQLAWKRGLKTTYYLRTLAATQVEKNQISEPVNQSAIESSKLPVYQATAICALDNPECEACQ